jgi:hypothetical protein
MISVISGEKHGTSGMRRSGGISGSQIWRGWEEALFLAERSWKTVDRREGREEKIDSESMDPSSLVHGERYMWWWPSTVAATVRSVGDLQEAVLSLRTLIARPRVKLKMTLNQASKVEIGGGVSQVQHHKKCRIKIMIDNSRY